MEEEVQELDYRHRTGFVVIFVIASIFAIAGIYHAYLEFMFLEKVKEPDLYNNWLRPLFDYQLLFNVFAIISYIFILVALFWCIRCNNQSRNLMKILLAMFLGGVSTAVMAGFYVLHFFLMWDYDIPEKLPAMEIISYVIYGVFSVTCVLQMEMSQRRIGCIIYLIIAIGILIFVFSNIPIMSKATL